MRNRPLNKDEQEAAALEVKAIAAAEKDKSYEQALKYLQQAIDTAPQYPSPYNNRAQVYRLMGKMDEALEDLNKAIAQSPVNDFPLVRRQALAQRGWIYFRDESKSDAAFADFEEAAKLGCEESKQMAVRCNPYARLCSSIMQEVFSKLYYSKPDI